jgi:transposase
MQTPAPTSAPRKPYPRDVSDDEWAFIAPYLTRLAEDAGQHRYPLREVFNALRSLGRSGATRRLLPHDLPPWPLVYQQTRRWLAAGGFAAAVHDLRLLLRRAAGRPQPPSAAILDARVVQSTPESGARAGWSGPTRRRGSKVHLAVDTLGDLLALGVTPASADERTQGTTLARQVQAVTGEQVEIACVDAGYSGPEPARAAARQGIELVVVKLVVVKLPVVKLVVATHGFVLLPRRWVVERACAGTARFRRLARDYERLAVILAGLPFVVFTCLMLHQWIPLISTP